MIQYNLAQSVVQSLTELAPTFIVVCIFFVILSWLRLVVDAMSGRGL